MKKSETKNQNPTLRYNQGWWYWNVDREEFRAKGKVDLPLFSTKVFQEAQDFKNAHPNSIIVRTKVGMNGITYQQVTRHEVKTRFSKSV